MSKEEYGGISTLLSDTVVHVQKNDLYGFWTDGSTENVTFEIKHDSIYYVDQSEAYKYVLEDGFIKIYYPDFIFKGRVKIDNDELNIVSEDGSATFTRFTN
jgi:hypothetical protein